MYSGTVTLYLKLAWNIQIQVNSKELRHWHHFDCVNSLLYIDDVLSINNPEFENYLGKMYPTELKIKDTTESTTSASYLDLLMSIRREGQLYTSIHDKRDDFIFHITKFLFLSSNIIIPSSPSKAFYLSVYTIHTGLSS